MKNNKFRTIWSICEKIIAYCALAIVVILEIVSLVAPSLGINSSDLALGLIASSLLVIFSHVEDIKKSFNKASKNHFSSDFDKGIEEISAKNKNHIKTLDIMAHTTRTYIRSFQNKGVIIDNVRLLVCKPKNSLVRQYPNQDAVGTLDGSRDNAVMFWKDLYNNGTIKNLQIKYYEFDPTFFFAIINNQYVHYGLYKIEHTEPGYHLFHLYTIDGSTSEMEFSQLKDYQGFFDHIFNNFSYEENM